MAKFRAFLYRLAPVLALAAVVVHPASWRW
jgi:hypothetical protein